jgi:hypothetical protein
MPVVGKTCRKYFFRHGVRDGMKLDKKFSFRMMRAGIVNTSR